MNNCTLTDEELVQRVREINSKLCETGGKSWSLTVPPNPNQDTYLLIEELILRFEKERGTLHLPVDIFVASFDKKTARLELAVPREIAGQIDHKTLSVPMLIWWGDISADIAQKTGKREGLIVAPHNPEQEIDLSVSELYNKTGGTIINRSIPVTVDFLNAKIKSLPSGEPGKVSDGYHTFDELYEHRIRLYIALARVIATDWLLTKDMDPQEPTPVWISKKHNDDTAWEGWFIMGVCRHAGRMITYHLPERFWDEVAEFADVLEKGLPWDGHTSADVLERLRTLNF